MRKILAVLTALMSVSGLTFAEEIPELPKNQSILSGPQLNRARENFERARVAKQIEEDQQRIRAKEQQNPPEAKPEGDNVTFMLNELEVDESVVLPAEELQKLTKDFVGSWVSLNDLYQIVSRINNMYAEGGYVTCKAFLPQQTIKNGKVHIVLVEGKVGAVTVEGNRYTRDGFFANRVSLPEGKVSSIKDLNREMMRFNGTNDVQLRLVLQAGKEPGTTDYVLQAYEPQQFTATVFADNAGNYTSGTYREGVFFNVRSVTGIRDSLSVGGTYSEGTKALSASYSLPIGSRDTRLIFGYSTNRVETVRGSFRDMDVDGNSSSYSMEIRQPIVVNDTTRSEISVDGMLQNSKTDILDTHWVDDDMEEVNVNLSLTNYGKSHVFYQKHTYTAYGHNRNIVEQGEKFNVYRFTALYQKMAEHGRNLTWRADAQWAQNHDGLPSARQFYLGGMNSVRGYKESFLSGDSGFSSSLEYNLPIGHAVTPYVFYDYGWLDDQNAMDKHILQSVGFGIKANISKNIYSNLSLAVPLIRHFDNMEDGEVSKVRVHYIVSGVF